MEFQKCSRFSKICTKNGPVFENTRPYKKEITFSKEIFSFLLNIFSYVSATLNSYIDRATYTQLDLSSLVAGQTRLGSEVVGSNPRAVSFFLHHF